MQCILTRCDGRRHSKAPFESNGIRHIKSDLSGIKVIADCTAVRVWRCQTSHVVWDGGAGGSGFRCHNYQLTSFHTESGHKVLKDFTQTALHHMWCGVGEQEGQEGAGGAAGGGRLPRQGRRGDPAACPEGQAGALLATSPTWLTSRGRGGAGIAFAGARIVLKFTLHAGGWLVHAISSSI